MILNICISPRGQHLKSQTERLPRTLMLKIWKKWLPCNLQTYGRPTRAWRAPDGTKELYQFCPFRDVWVIWWFWVPTQENWRTMFLLKIGYSQLWKEGSFRDTERGESNKGYSVTHSWKQLFFYQCRVDRLPKCKILRISKGIHFVPTMQGDIMWFSKQSERTVDIFLENKSDVTVCM